MALTVVERPATGPARRLLLLLPGFGDEPETFAGHIDALDPRGRWHVAVVRPRLDTPEGPGWFTVGDDGPVGDELVASVGALDAAAATLLDRLGLGPDDLVVAGFSQGGAMALASALDPTVAVRPGSVAALAAYLPHREHGQDATLVAGRPVLIAHGADDEVVDALLGRSAAKALDRAGADVTWAEVDGGHQLAPRLLDALRSWLDGLAATDGTDGTDG